MAAWLRSQMMAVIWFAILQLGISTMERISGSRCVQRNAKLYFRDTLNFVCMSLEPNLGTRSSKNGKTVWFDFIFKNEIQI